MSVNSKSVDAALTYLKSGTVLPHEYVFFNQTRDQSNARIIKWIDFFKSKNINLNESIILGSILGELTNNSFDHNLGQWKSVPGCLVALDIDLATQTLQLVVADKGQGIISSLKNTVAPIIDPEVILKKAFLERISGRAPEKRGNGLKFVLKHISEKNNYLLCVTQGQTFSIGDKKTKNPIAHADLPKDSSTLIYIEWSIT